MSESPWAHLDRLKAEHDAMVSELDALGWTVVEPEDVFIVARRRAWLHWGTRPRRVRARKPGEVLAEVKRLEAEFAEAQKSQQPKT